MTRDIHSLVDKAVENLLENYVDISPGRQIVILFDDQKSALAQALARGLSARRALPRLLCAPQGVQALQSVLPALLSDPQIGLFVLASPQMWRDGLAAYLDPTVEPVSLRGACRPLFFDAVIPPDSLVRLYGSDVGSDRRYLSALAASLPDRARVRLTAPGGTDLHMVSRSWRLSAWEVLTSPLEPSVSGRIVADASVFCGRVASPIAVEITCGQIVSIQSEQQDQATCRDYVRWMIEARDANPANWQLAEVGLGGNARAILSGVIMEDEAVRNTAHFCFGDNTRYGGANCSNWHGGTLVIRSPRIERL